MTEDENIIHIFMNIDEISKNKCIPLSDKDYEKIKNYGNVEALLYSNAHAPFIYKIIKLAEF